MKIIRAITLLLLFSALLPACAETSVSADPAIECPDCAEWNAPQAPFKIYGNTYYVGVAGLSVILIDTGDGLILLDGALPQSVPLIVDNIEALGFSLEDVRLIAVSHAHYDHVGGIAALQRATGARVVASLANAQAMQRGDLGPEDPQFGSRNTAFPPVIDVELVEDKQVIRVGDTALSVIATPGHTPGGTSWSWSACVEDDCKTVVYADSMSAIAAVNYSFRRNGKKAAGQIRKSAQRISALDCDVFLAPHPFYFDMSEKLAQGDAEDAFVDSACEAYGQQALDGLEKRLQMEMRF